MLRALEKDPTVRYPTMAAFASDLRAFVELRATVARPPSLLQRGRRWVRREPWRAALAGTATLAAAMTFWLLTRLDTLRAGEVAATASAYESAIQCAVRRF